MNKPKPPPISPLEAKEILEWYFCCSDYCSGHRSNFAAFAAFLAAGISPGPQGAYYDPEADMTDGVLRSITRTKRIRSILAKVSPQHQWKLRAYFDQSKNKYSAPLTAFFDDLTPLIIRQHGVRAAEDMIRKGNEAVSYTAKSKARAGLNEALEEFANAWSLNDPTRSLGPPRDPQGIQSTETSDCSEETSSKA